MNLQPLWIAEADVVAMMALPDAINALEKGLKLQAEGASKNMRKTHLSWGGGHTLHAIGAIFEQEGLLGTKTWAHTAGGATPLFIMWDANSGALLAVIEAFALGQMRTGAMSGVATRWMARRDADSLALIGTGKQAMTQLAAVAAVRPLKTVRVFGPNSERRARFVENAKGQGFDFKIEEADSAATREPVLKSAMVARGAHINAIGAITTEREEFAQDIMDRAELIAADDPGTTRSLSKEFRTFFGDSDQAWKAVLPISSLIAASAERSADCDLSVFKAMGMGISDLALGMQIYRSAQSAGRGRALEPPEKVKPRLRR
jgi:ornithine cyclodeaminase